MVENLHHRRGSAWWTAAAVGVMMRGGDVPVTKRSFAERFLAVIALASVVGAMALAHRVDVPDGGDAWSDGSKGAWLWLCVGLVPVVAAGLATAARRRGRRGGVLVLGMGAAVAMSTLVGEAMHVSDPPVDRGTLGALGVGLDVAAVVMAAGTVGTLLRPRLARHVGPIAVTAGVVTSVVFGIAGDPTPNRGRCRRSLRCRCRRSPSSGRPARRCSSSSPSVPSSPPG